MCANAAIRHKQLYFNQETVWTFFLFFNPYSALLYYFFTCISLLCHHVCLILILEQQSQFSSGRRSSVAF